MGNERGLAGVGGDKRGLLELEVVVIVVMVVMVVMVGVVVIVVVHLCSRKVFP